MQPHDHSSLPRRLGLWTSIAVVVGSTIGSGIFRTPSGIAAHLPGPLPMLGVWAAGGLLVLCGALTLAEIAGALPNTGGIYVFIREGWGRLAAFLFGWTQLVMVRAAALGALAITFAEYLLRVLGYDSAAAPYIAALAIAITCASNILGIRFGAAIQNLTTLAKYGGLVVIIVLAFAIGLPATGGHYTPLAPVGSFSVSAFGLALVSILWAYDGWADLSFVGGEVTNPRRNLPRALILGTLAVIAIYLLANLAYLAVLPMDHLRQSQLVAADAVEQVWPGAGLVFVATTVMISTFGTLNATTLTAPRIFYAMADDKLFFRRVAAVHPQFQTPYVAIIIVGSIGVLFVLYSPITHFLHYLDLPMLRVDPSAAAETFTRLTDAFVTAMVPFYALGVAAIFPLRRSPAYNPAFRAPGYPVVPALFIASSVLILVNAVVDPSSRWMTIGVLVVILLGIPVYYCTVARNETGARSRAVMKRAHILVVDDDAFENIIGASQSMRRVFELVEQVAASNVDVLVRGDTGTGKELIARAIHRRSPRASGPFVPIDCGAIPDNLLESELFGHERGSFTGADSRQIGLLEFAHGGTVFLDELGELPLLLQAKLLRALQERKIRRVGGRDEAEVDVRVVAATARELDAMVKQGLFREDLYYRINVVQIELPPLRLRGDDIGLLAEFFANRHSREMGKPIGGITPEAYQVLRQYPWPGNVRELQNVIRRGIALSKGTMIGLDDLPDEVVIAAGQRGPGDSVGYFELRDEHVARFERQYLTDLLTRHAGDVQSAAREAKLPRGTLYRLMKNHGFDSAAFRAKQ